MNRKQIFCVVLGVGAVLAMSGVVDAWDYSCFSPYSCGGYWYPPSSFNQGELVPYFILHPPVYYSYAVPRPYGFSPFPYPPYVLTPERRPVGALVDQAPCAAGQVSTITEPARAKQPPLRIQNPFVTQTAGNVSPAGDTAAKGPVVILPPALAETQQPK